MDNKPKVLTDDEINEIAAIKDIQEMWGAESADEMASLLQEEVYAAKFDFKSGGQPRNPVEIYVLFGNAPGVPIRLIRVKGKLEFLD